MSMIVYAAPCPCGSEATWTAQDANPAAATTIDCPDPDCRPAELPAKPAAYAAGFPSAAPR